jgi:hypothetical protein
LQPFDWTIQEINDGKKREIKPICVLENGAVYQGEWLVDENQKDGRGVQIWPDGSRYDGFWRDGMANGYGRLVHAEGDVYEGEWTEDKANGYGVYTHFNGSRYEGQWFQDKQHGFGVEQWPDGAKYEGQYE